MRKLTIIALVVFAGCVTVRDVTPEVHHVVLCWLKDPGNAEHRQRIVDVSRSFSDIPGVMEVRAGEVIESDRKIVDDSFDVAITVSFANTADMKRYLAHPIHEEAKRDVLLPVVNKIVVYDFRE